MCAQGRAYMPGRGQAGGEFDRAGDLPLRLAASARHFAHRLTSDELGMLGRFAQREHRLDASIQFGDYLAPIGVITLLELDGDLALQRLLLVRFGL